MVNRSSDSNPLEGGKKKSSPTLSKGVGGGGGGGATREWGTTVSGQSMSSSGSMGSPSSRSEAAVATPVSVSQFGGLNNLEVPGDDAGSQEPG